MASTSNWRRSTTKASVAMSYPVGSRSAVGLTQNGNRRSILCRHTGVCGKLIRKASIQMSKGRALQRPVHSPTGRSAITLGEIVDETNGGCGRGFDIRSSTKCHGCYHGVDHGSAKINSRPSAIVPREKCRLVSRFRITIGAIRMMELKGTINFSRNRCRFAKAGVGDDNVLDI